MELSLDQALKQGVEAHKAGKLQEADRYYTAILKAQPKNPDANHNMGVLALTKLKNHSHSLRQHLKPIQILLNSGLVI